MFDEATANRYVSFIESLKHVEGEWAGKPIILEPDQKQIVRELFGTLNADGLRQYRMGYISVPRKWGKSTLAAAILLAILLLDHEIGAQIYLAAADRDNASIIFRMIAQMAQQSAVIMSKIRTMESTKRIIYPAENSYIHAISAEAYSKHGFNMHAGCYDELHSAPNRDLWDVLNTSSGARRQPLLIQITTAGYDRQTICYEQYSYAKRILAGEVDDPTYYAFIREAEQTDDWKDRDVWKKAQPNLGITVKEDYYEREFRRAVESPSYQNTFRRLLLNQWTEQVTRWLDMDKWNLNNGYVDVNSLNGSTCYAGMDLSTTTDLTSVVLAFPLEDQSFALLPKFWIPEDNLHRLMDRDKVPYDAWVRDGYVATTPGPVINYNYVREYIRNCAEQFELKEIAYDRWNATQLVTDLDDDGFTLIPFGQGFMSMSPAAKSFEELLLQNRIMHGSDPVLSWNAGNVSVRTDPAGNIKPDKDKSTARIDGIIASIMALDRAVRNSNAGSVYEERGLRTI